MDSSLRSAAKNGDLRFLKEAVSLQTSEYFLTKTPKDELGGLGGNIFHVSAWSHQEDFFREAIKLLPEHDLKRLLFQTEDDFRYTPLHAASVKTDASHAIVKLIIEFYNSITQATNDVDDDVRKPWLALTHDNRMPLHLALKDDKENEPCALELLALDADLLSCTIVDDHGCTPLFYALQNGFNQISEKILMSPLPFASIFRDKDGLTPFHLAHDCSDNIWRLLFEKCVDYMDKTDDQGFTVLHLWAEKGEAGPCKLLLESDVFGELKTKIFTKLVYATENKMSDTPMHMAARKKQSELAQIMLRGYQQQQASVVTAENQEPVSVECPPWKIKNNAGNTPLHTALYVGSSHEEFALQILSIDPLSCQIRNNKGESPFFLAVMSGCARAADEILKIEEPRFDFLRRNDGQTVLHCLPSCPENIGRKLLEKYWWMINLTDDSRKTALDKAKEANVLWLVNLLTNPSLIQKERFDWIAACKREETQAVLAFIDHCQDLQRACREVNDTPLHHIKLLTHQDYVNLLQISSIKELKNTTDHEGATPLHRALERKDMLLAKVLLLDDGVERTIADHNGRTALDLLAKLCEENDDWENMCKNIKVNPYMKTSYIRSGTNLDQIRNTLSVVAALLATITFAAGFTLPGGINGTGEAVLAKKASFLVFLLADVYAMCTAILVLFCLIWSMVSEPDMARLLVDRSVFILMQSLYGTLLAFMTGIYTVVAKSSLWAVILIFVMCSIIVISAHRKILHYVIAKFIPASSTNAERQDQMQSLEEGNAGPSLARSLARNDTSRNVE
ncbi:hypothetical protein RND81_09G034400 [Saponaria officinalis]|uniref:PGG domain-containing protein n=1 Tax=Saponaria officinalis TaxID=3572 RepID=A0AAW1II39_SAPOF